MTGEGCSKERRQHSKIVTEPRNVTRGGRVIGFGNRDTEHCYLDFLLNEKLLGMPRQASDRYETGCKLRRLYFSFRASGKAMTEIMAGGHTSVFVGDENIDVEGPEDFYNSVMGEVPQKFKRIVRMICLEDVTPVRGTDPFHRLVRDGLDALNIAFRKEESAREERLRKLREMGMVDDQ